MASVVLEEHLSVQEIFSLYRQCSDPVAKSHWQVIWLKSQGKSTREVADIMGFKPDWIRRLIHRYNSLGPEGVRDFRQDNGRRRLLCEAQIEALVTALQNPHPDGGLWNGPKVAIWIGELLGRKIHPSRGWDYLRLLEMRLLVPRPRYVDNSDEVQDAFKKKLPKSSNRSGTITPMPMFSFGRKMKHA